MRSFRDVQGSSRGVSIEFQGDFRGFQSVSSEGLQKSIRGVLERSHSAVVSKLFSGGSRKNFTGVSGHF